MSAYPSTPLGSCVLRVETWNPLRAAPDEEFRYIDLSAVDQDTKSITEAREIACAEAPSRARQLVRTGDVLVSTVRPNLNGVARVPNDLNGATASTGFCVLRPDPEVAVHLSEVLRALGRKDDAQRVLHEALKNFPANAQLVEAIKKFSP